MKKLIASFLITFSSAVLACPGCAGSMDDPLAGNVVYILGVFILLTYIPFYLIYRTIIKHRNANALPQDGTGQN
jgi:hypothetical protein